MDTFIWFVQVYYKMIKAFGDQIFLSGFLHGDPHAANGTSHCGEFVVRYYPFQSDFSPDD